MKKHLLNAIPMILLLLLGTTGKAQTTYTVTNTSDAGTGSLRQAILDLNSGGSTKAVNTIQFHIGTQNAQQSIQTPAVQTITLTSYLLPRINKPVVIDGYSQSVWEGLLTSTGPIGKRNITIEINGGSLTNYQSDGSGGDGNGLFLFSSNASGIGSKLTTLDGVAIGNTGYGVSPILLQPNVSNVQLWGNYIGTHADGVTAWQNRFDGIQISDFVNSTSGTYSNIIIGKKTSNTNNYEGNIISNNVGSSTDTTHGAYGSAGISIGNLASTSPKTAKSTTYTFQGVSIAGNYIGINAGNAAAFNGPTGSLASNAIWRGEGIFIYQAAATGGSILIGSNGDGYGDSFERNVISGNKGSGVYLSNYGPISNVAIAGNYVGTDTSGTTAVSNATYGSYLSGITDVNTTSGNILIGGNSAVTRNIISGNTYYGMGFNNIPTTATVTVAGNYIGTDVSGNIRLANGRVSGNNSSGYGEGIDIYNCKGANINSASPSFLINNNVISGNNGSGIDMYNNTQGIAVVSNSIGVGANGIAVVGNSQQGISLGNVSSGDNSSNNRIGSNDDGTNDNTEGNTIANNGTVGGYPGITITKTANTGNRISRNNFYSNGWLPLDLNGDGVTLNDGSLESNTANQSIDYPVFTSQTITSPTSVTVSGYIGNSASATDSTAGTLLNDGTLTVQLYKRVNDGNQNGYLTAAYQHIKRAHGEGLYLGSFTVSESTFNNVAVNVVSSVSLQPSDSITGIVIDANGNTSEFGASFLPPPVSLPITYLNRLAAAVNNGAILLTWATATEINNKGFIVQFSTDGKSFTNKSLVPSQATDGNSSSALFYSYSDAFPGKGTNYYRLIQTDLDGHQEISNVVAMNLTGNTPLQLYPNPAHGTITLNGLTAGESVAIYNTSGQLLKSFVATTVLQQIDISGWASGIYFVKAVSGTNKLTVSFMVK